MSRLAWRGWRAWVLGGVAALSVICTAQTARAADHCCLPSDWDACFLEPPSHAPDAVVFFEGLVDRYRRLAMYSDVVRMVQITHRHGEKDQRVETELNCTVKDGQLEVLTPARQLTRSLGVAIPLKSTEELDAVKQRQNLWLAPHLSLKFADKPLESLRPGVDDGFTPTEVTEITVDERDMVEIELKSGDGLSEDCEARCNLLINPDSMLIERIQVNQRMADGSTQETTLDIQPRDVIDRDVHAGPDDHTSDDTIINEQIDEAHGDEVETDWSDGDRRGFGDGRGRSTTPPDRSDG